MKPLRPFLFTSHDLGRSAVETAAGGREFLHLLRGVGATFSTVLLAHAARSGVKAVVGEVSRMLAGIGLNVFQGRTACPIVTLSHELGRRSMPLGLYLDETCDNRWSLTPLAMHGGPVDDEFLDTASNQPLSRLGVVGEVGIHGGYVSRLSGLLDPRPDPGIRFSRIECPFAQIAEELETNDAPVILRERDAAGPVARIDPSGQMLTVEFASGKTLTTIELVQTIGNYLTRERATTGTVIGPPGTKSFAESWGEVTEVQGDALDMSHVAGYANLLLGWWEPGIVAHQGNGPFGDALLTAGYLLEAWSTHPPKET